MLFLEVNPLQCKYFVLSFNSTVESVVCDRKP